MRNAVKKWRTSQQYPSLDFRVKPGSNDAFVEIQGKPLGLIQVKNGKKGYFQDFYFSSASL